MRMKTKRVTIQLDAVRELLRRGGQRLRPPGVWLQGVQSTNANAPGNITLNETLTTIVNAPYYTVGSPKAYYIVVSHDGSGSDLIFGAQLKSFR